jgi:hypothetical protein
LRADTVIGAGTVNRRLPPTVSAATVSAIAATIEPASVVIVVATTVVSTCGFVSVVLTATTRAKGDACDHQHNHHYRDN